MKLHHRNETPFDYNTKAYIFFSLKHLKHTYLVENWFPRKRHMFL